MPRRVLLCDDEIHILRAAEFKLKRAGYEVEIAGDGQEGWEIIERRPPDIVITDCQMPRCDGLGLVRRMREHPVTQDIPVLMLTAKGFELSASELAEKYNVLGLIAKPFSPRELLQTVNTILDDPSGQDAVSGGYALPLDGCLLPSGFLPEVSTEI